jgi:hypothetical protein
MTQPKISSRDSEKELDWATSNTAAALVAEVTNTDEHREERIAIPSNVVFFKERLSECIGIVDDLLPKEQQYTSTWAFLVGMLLVRNTIPLSRLGAKKKQDVQKSKLKTARVADKYEKSAGRRMTTTLRRCSV